MRNWQAKLGRALTAMSVGCTIKFE